MRTVLALSMLACSALAQTDPPARPRVEVAFVLDTTGSMSGLIQAAKQKIWAIANEIARAKPSPDLRIGLVAYRDRKDAYVTRVRDLDADLDRVYQELSGYQAGGGGDHPESVNEALRTAVTKLSWSAAPSVLKLVFLVGDAPPHMDYGDVPYAKTCEEAVRANLVINALRCGRDGETERVWQEIARRSEGSYASLPQEGGAVAVATPFDKRLGEIGEALGRTLVAWGDLERRDDVARKVERSEGLASSSGPAAAPDAVRAERSLVLSKLKSLDASDLVAAVEEKRVELEKIKDEDLPEELRKLSPEERVRFIAARSGERAGLRKEAEGLERLRAAFLAEKSREAKPGASVFDREVTRMIRDQAAKKGFRFE
jgi:Mg-chelatase subunit ChlD